MPSSSLPSRLAPGNNGATRSTSARTSKSSLGGASTSISFWIYILPLLLLEVHQSFTLPSVDRDVGPVYKARLRGSEEGHQISHLLRFADSSERDTTYRQLVGPLAGDSFVPGERFLKPFPPIGVDGTGIDRVDAYTEPSVLLCHSRSEVDVCSVGDPCGGLPVSRFESVVAHHEDHTSASLLLHKWKNSPASPHVTHKLKVETVEPIVFRQKFEEAPRGATSTGNEDINSAEGVNRIVHSALNVFGLAHVAQEWHYLLARRFGQLPCGLFKQLLTARGDNDRAPLFGEHPGTFLADALAGPRDKSN